MERWDRLKQLEDWRDANPDYLNTIKKFNNKFEKILKTLGLKLEYNCIFLPKNGKRTIESHSYKISFDFTAIEWSILGLLTHSKKVSKKAILYPTTKDGSYIKEFDFSINVSNELLVNSLPQIFLNENIMEKAVGFLIEEFKKIDKFATIVGHDDTTDIEFKNNGIKKVAIEYLKSGKVAISLKVLKLLSKNLADNTDFKLLHNFEKKNPELFNKLCKFENRLKLGSEMGELGFN